jgi:hypothetical protein
LAAQRGKALQDKGAGDPAPFVLRKLYGQINAVFSGKLGTLRKRISNASLLTVQTGKGRAACSKGPKLITLLL